MELEEFEIEHLKCLQCKHHFIYYQHLFDMKHNFDMHFCCKKCCKIYFVNYYLNYDITKKIDDEFDLSEDRMKEYIKHIPACSCGGEIVLRERKCPSCSSTDLSQIKVIKDNIHYEYLQLEE